jgi:hypothetical protein
VPAGAASPTDHGAADQDRLTAIATEIAPAVGRHRFWAAHLGIELDSLTVRVAGDLDLRGFFGTGDGVRPGFTAVTIEVAVTGPETQECYAELAAAVDEHCPVLDLFRNPVPVTRAIAAAR